MLRHEQSLAILLTAIIRPTAVYSMRKQDTDLEANAFLVGERENLDGALEKRSGAHTVECLHSRNRNDNAHCAVVHAAVQNGILAHAETFAYVVLEGKDLACNGSIPY